MAQHPASGRHHVRTLSFCFAPLWTDTDFLLVLQQTPSLERLSLQTLTDITDMSLQQLPRHLGRYCAQLTELTLSRCRELGPDTFSALKNCPFKSLTIELSDMDGHMSEKMIMDLTSSGFDGLVQLSLGSKTFDSDFIDRLLSAAAAAASSWPHLTHLTIYNYRINPIGDNDGGGGGALISFLQSHPGLKELSLMMGRYDDTFLYALANIHPPPPNLTHLALDLTRHISGSAVRCLVEHWPMLCSVTLCDCGMTPAMFPESSQESHYETLNDVTVEYLDQDTIHKIQLGRHASRTETDNNNNNKRFVWKWPWNIWCVH
ncbi:unnamed protein product [Absidia cylindrospora]